MEAEGKITMTEFKTVVESFRSEIKTVVEVMNHRFDRLEEYMSRQESKSDTLLEQIVLLRKEQAGIISELQSTNKERTTFKE